jgi:hypothetical protein
MSIPTLRQRRVKTSEVYCSSSTGRCNTGSVSDHRRRGLVVDDLYLLVALSREAAKLRAVRRESAGCRASATAMLWAGCGASRVVNALKAGRERRQHVRSSSLSASAGVL